MQPLRTGPNSLNFPRLSPINLSAPTHIHTAEYKLYTQYQQQSLCYDMLCSCSRITHTQLISLFCWPEVSSDLRPLSSYVIHWWDLVSKSQPNKNTRAAPTTAKVALNSFNLRSASLQVFSVCRSTHGKELQRLPIYCKITSKMVTSVSKCPKCWLLCPKIHVSLA